MRYKSLLSLARPGGFEPPTPRFVGWLSPLKPQQNFANRANGPQWHINGLGRFCKPTELELRSRQIEFFHPKKFKSQMIENLLPLTFFLGNLHFDAQYEATTRTELASVTLPRIGARVQSASNATKAVVFLSITYLRRSR